MLLVISQVIVLLANSGSINQLPEPVSVNEQAITLDDLKAVNDDLNEVRKSLDGINSNSEPKDDHVEVKKVESEAVVVPLTLDDLKAVNTDLSKVRKSLNEINSNSDLEDNHVEAKNVESKPVVVPPAPVVLKNHKENIKPKQKITENKKVVLIEKSPVVTLVPVSSDDESIQSIEKPADEVIIAADIKPAYIKYDAKGNLLEDNNEQWTCVFDTNTGLMWEVKSEEDAMRNSENLYSWYNPDKKALNNKALKGVTDGGRCKGDTDCDTNAYVQEMNKRNYCGHNDWHLPSREEMQTLVDLKNEKAKVKINKQYFPQTMPSWYWTSSDENNKDDFAWYVLFRNGVALSDLKERPKHIRLVRNNI